MRKLMAWFVVMTLSGAPAMAQSAAAPAATRLSVKRVVLYKNGVGYFEHSGHIRGKQEVAVQFTTAQLDDVLKSLTVIDSAGGQIAGVSYNSLAPLSKRLGTLRVPLGEETTLADFLRVLRGTRIEARNGTQLAAGRLLSVERREQTRDGEVVHTTEQVSLVTDAGEVRTFELTPATAIRIADGELKEDVARYLALLASTREQDLRRMTIATTGTGERELLVSYISEVPIWKSTYRLVLPTKPGAKPLLQGWAIVDNTVGEDWDGVELSLVAGTPQSFLQALSQPYYGRRPTVALPESAMLTPQTHEATMEAVADEAPSLLLQRLSWRARSKLFHFLATGQLTICTRMAELRAARELARAVVVALVVVRSAFGEPKPSPHSRPQPPPTTSATCSSTA